MMSTSSSSDDTREPEKIPEPPNRNARSYVRFVRPEDAPDFLQAKALIRKILPEELDVERSWSSQDKGVTKRFIDKIVEVYPTFARYKEAWPILYQCYRDLGELRRNLGPQYKAPRRPRKRLSLAGSYRSKASRITGAAGSSRIAPFRPACSPAENRTPTQGCGKTGCEIAPMADKPREEGTCADVRRPEAAPDNVVSLSPENVNIAQPSHQGSTVRLTIDENTPPGEQEVLRFLATLNRTFTSLLERFRLAGITSHERLLGLAQWESHERDYFLARDVRLDPFEQRMVSAGLAKLLQGSEKA
ncbi:hypothetical protein C8Q77DRAFT_1087486 [Trametes polyzona]|nr:hypothetical protein C8Q77DRAFT_1087486 [Trametes polyzona]